MFLAVDIGNSQTSFGVFDGPALKYHWRAETKASRTSDEFASLLFPLMERAGLKGDWSSVVLCSVVPQADAAFRGFCQHYWKMTPANVDVTMNLGFKVNVENPREVGADRLANSAYACEHLKLPAIVVDLGTATTFDVIGVERAYEGGVILPGVRLAFEALGSKTSKLTMVDVEFPKNVIGKTTTHCIQSGILHGYCDLIDGLLARTQIELGKDAEIALTGGYSALFHSRLRTRTKHLPNLTLEGIEILSRRLR